MKVLLLTYGSLNTISGGYLYNRQLVNYLQEAGDTVAVVSLDPGRFWQNIMDNVYDECLDLISAFKPDIVVQDTIVKNSVFLQNSGKLKRLNVPLVALVHLLANFERHPWGLGWLHRKLELRYLHSVDGVIANSQTTLFQLQTLLKQNLPQNCIATPAGNHFGPLSRMAAGQLEERCFASGALRILVVGNVIRRKGLHVLIRALQHMASDHFQVTVVGRLDMEPAYVCLIQEMIEQSGMQQQISLAGVVHGADLADIYQQHHLMVLPSHYESYGIVYVEAQQFGLPVIGCLTGAASEIIQHGTNGYLIGADDHEALAKLLQELQVQRDKLYQLSQNSLAAFSGYPTWQQSCQTIRTFLQSIVA